MFLVHRSQQGLDDEKGNHEPRREDRQRHQIDNAQTVFFWMAYVVKTALPSFAVMRGGRVLLQAVQGLHGRWQTASGGDTTGAAPTDEIKHLRRESRDLKEVVVEQRLELRLLK